MADHELRNRLLNLLREIADSKAPFKVVCTIVHEDGHTETAWANVGEKEVAYMLAWFAEQHAKPGTVEIIDTNRKTVN